MKGLNPGDIFFVKKSNPITVLGQWFASISRENYEITHVGMIIENNDGSVKYGVHTVEITREGILKERKPLSYFMSDEIIVYRHIGVNPNIDNNMFDVSSVALEAGRFAEFIGDSKKKYPNDYAYLSALGSVSVTRFRGQNRPQSQIDAIEKKWNSMFDIGIDEALKKDNFFCSEFIVYCYELASVARKEIAIDLNLALASPSALYTEISKKDSWKKLKITIENMDEVVAQPENLEELLVKYSRRSRSEKTITTANSIQRIYPPHHISSLNENTQQQATSPPDNNGCVIS